MNRCRLADKSKIKRYRASKKLRFTVHGDLIVNAAERPPGPQGSRSKQVVHRRSWLKMGAENELRHLEGFALRRRCLALRRSSLKVH